jgi:hypothetical protein
MNRRVVTAPQGSVLVEPDRPEGIASLLAAGRSASHFGELEGGACFAYWPAALRREGGRWRVAGRTVVSIT